MGNLPPGAVPRINRCPTHPKLSRKEIGIMDQEEEEKETQPLTDEELAEYQKKEQRKVNIIGTIIDFFAGFFT